MLISEIFHSIQGEGMLAGMPSVFVRTSGCNLRCRWCDTPYASWKPEGNQMNVDEIMEVVSAFECRHVVVTGGEPMVAKGMPDLLRALRAKGHHITIETAGTVPPNGAEVDLASISPKLAHSTPDAETAGPEWVQKHEVTRLQPAVLREWCENYDVQLKFVVSSEADLCELTEMVESIGIPIPPETILLMPEGTDLETLQSRRSFIVDACKLHGYRYSPRLHIDLFGNTRGT